MFMAKSITYLHLALSICRGDPLLPTGETRSAIKASRPEREGDLAMNRRELILQGLRLACISPQIPHKKEKYTPRAVDFLDSCSVVGTGLIMGFPAKECEVHPQRMRINATTFSADNIIYNAYQ